MTAFLIYTFKVSCCLLGFYVVFHLLFRKKGYFQLNRFYLLYTTLLSFAVPLLPFPFQVDLTNDRVPVVQNIMLPMHHEAHMAWEAIAQPMHVQAPIVHITVGQVLGWIYIMGMGYFAFIFLRRLYSLYRIIGESKVHIVANKRTLVHPKMPTASFFRFLFWRDADQKIQDADIVLRHELVHAKQWHSLDIIIIELCTIILWFNPLLHFIRRELQLIHEFIADQTVVRHFNEPNRYVEILANSLPRTSPNSLTIPFHSFLKTRLQMLKRENARLIELIPYFLIIPMIVLLVVVFSNWVGNKTNIHPTLMHQLSELKNKSIWNSTAASAADRDLILQWGDLTIKAPMATYDRIVNTGLATIEVSYQYRGELTKPALLELVDQEIKLDLVGYDARRGDYLQINAGHQAKRPEGAVVQHDLGERKPLALGNNIIDFLKSTEANSRLSIHGSIDGHSYGFNFKILNHEVKKHYLRWKNEQFHVTSYHRIPTQVIDVDKLIELMEHTPRLFIEGQEQSRSNQPTTLLLKGPTQMVSMHILGRLFDAEGKIPHPIAIKMQANDGTPYYALFDDEPRPTVTYSTWDDLVLEPIRTSEVNIVVEEKPWNIQWGPLSTSRAPTSMEGVHPYPFPYDIYVDGRQVREGKLLTLSNMKRVLAGKLTLSDGKQTFDQVGIHIKHITPKGIPERHYFNYRNGNVVEKEAMKALIANIQVGDFLDVFSIRPDGKKKDIHLYLALKNK